jgi:hypothetical protein
MSDEEQPPFVTAEHWAAISPAVQQAFLSLVDMVHTFSAEVKCLRTGHRFADPTEPNLAVNGYWQAMCRAEVSLSGAYNKDQ